MRDLCFAQAIEDFIEDKTFAVVLLSLYIIKYLEQIKRLYIYSMLIEGYIKCKFEYHSKI